MPKAKVDLAIRKYGIKSPDFFASLVRDCYRRLEFAFHMTGKLLEPVRKCCTVTFCREKKSDWNTIVVFILDNHGEQL